MAKRKKRYDLFYDESFHDRKLTANQDGELNIENNDQANNFVSSTVGIISYETGNFYNRYIDFEENVKKLLGLQNEVEFKGTTIGKKNFKYGIRSFNKNTQKIYSEFFNLLDEHVIVQISSLSKFELVIFSVFDEVEFPANVTQDRFFYSLIKFLNMYRNKKIISVLFDEKANTKKIIDTIMSLFDEVLLCIESVPRKKEEVLAIRNMKDVISRSVINMKTSSKYRWDYSRAISGIILLLEELGIKESSCTLYIDVESQTVSAAEKRSFKKVLSVDSSTYAGIRCADVLSNFIGRMLKTIDDEYLEDWDDEKTKISINQRRILSINWFDLNEEQFLLYRKIASVFAHRKDIYWTIQTGVYEGNTTALLSLIYYIGLEFPTYQDYKKITLESHRENFNSYSIERQLQSYQEKLQQFNY